MMLAGKIVTMAHKNDTYKAKDDISCATIYFREPRKLLICTGPPYEKEKDKELAAKVKGYTGQGDPVRRDNSRYCCQGTEQDNY